MPRDGNLIKETASISPGVNLVFNGNAEIDRNADNWPDNWYQWTASGNQPVTWANKGLKAEGITLGKKSLRVDSPGEDAFLGVSQRPSYDPKKDSLSVVM